ncbi:3-beta hydroxysteroid dehydrogenase [Kiloniella litopenaei]|uniref:3-beta hydroxysteroid dehydrogenase n=1 Tax=Kiloniella litopenaei TaxID=1549748 RepID=A0A0M2R8F4_9PROT|nr:complex I NDUFA9 subunit family protein [Kiloniella litopenaei]KKJ77956.1 3-beta hydroxysteroid dehydrogenase [Kiloniella litopenaei]
MNSSKIVTVFGGTGFVGRYVVARLAKAGWHVRIAVRDRTQSSFLSCCGDVGSVTSVYVDVTNKDALAQVISGSAAVVNLIGILFEGGRQRFDNLHSVLPGMLAEISQKNEVSAFVQISAIGADVSSPSAYGRSKGEGEAAVLKSFPSASVLRPSIVFGPEDDFFNRFARMAAVSPFLPLVGGGVAKFQPVYVGDVAEAVFRSVERPEEYGGKIYELGGPRVLSFRDCLDLLQKYTGCSRSYLALPFPVAYVQALFMELLPQPPLTRDQLKMLKKDNVVASTALGFDEFNISPVDVEVVLPTYLKMYSRE